MIGFLPTAKAFDIELITWHFVTESYRAEWPLNINRLLPAPLHFTIRNSLPSPLNLSSIMPIKRGSPLNMGHRRTGVGTRLKVGMRSLSADDLITGLKRVPTRVRHGVKMAPQGSLIVQKGPLSLALHPIKNQ